jgi:RNA polymerase sigma-70 factor (ECF subfamily)
MSRDDSLKTTLTLLHRLRQDPKDQAAWSDFVARYGPRILRWCRGWKLQESDAQDVTQVVLLKLNSLMARFVYDSSGSFRAWLKTLAHHAWQDLAAEHRRAGLGGGDGRALELVASPLAGDDLAEQLDLEFRREVMDHAIGRVRQRVSPRTWDAFRLTALEGLSGAAAAQRLEMKIARVYGARSAVKGMIREEVRSLEGLE